MPPGTPERRAEQKQFQGPLQIPKAEQYRVLGSRPEAFLPAAVRAPQTAQSQRLLGEARGRARQPTDALRHHWAHSGRLAPGTGPVCTRPVLRPHTVSSGRWAVCKGLRLPSSPIKPSVGVCTEVQSLGVHLRSVLTLRLYPSNTAREAHLKREQTWEGD